MVVYVIADQAAKMGFIQSDYMVQDLAAATTYPTLRNAILPGRSHTRLLSFQFRRVQERDDAVIELLISIQNHVTVGTGFWKRLTQLLHDPLRGMVILSVSVRYRPRFSSQYFFGSRMSSFPQTRTAIGP